MGGISMALGFKPRFEQPKNFKIQMFFLVASAIGMLFLLHYYKNTN